MAAANYPVVQSPAPQANVANPIPPPAPGNAPAGPVGAQLPANIAHVVQAHTPQGVATANHPVNEAVSELVGAAVAGPHPLPLGVGISPLSRSLYGWLLRN